MQFRNSVYFFMMICTPDLYFLYCDKMRPDAAILYCDSLCTVMKYMRPAAASVQNSKFEKNAQIPLPGP